MFLGGIKWDHLLITLIYAKQIIHLSGPVDEANFFAHDSAFLVLDKKGNITTHYSQ